MKTLIILRGLPGSGKSTVAELLSENGKYPVCTADDFFMKDGEYKFNPAQLGLAHGWCQKKAGEAMRRGDEKIIIANTNTTEREFKPYVEIAEEYGYMVICLVVENRHSGKNVHNVPEDRIQIMKERFDIKL